MVSNSGGYHRNAPRAMGRAVLACVTACVLATSCNRREASREEVAYGNAKRTLRDKGAKPNDIVRAVGRVAASGNRESSKLLLHFFADEKKVTLLVGGEADPERTKLAEALNAVAKSGGALAEKFLTADLDRAPTFGKLWAKMKKSPGRNHDRILALSHLPTISDKSYLLLKDLLHKDQYYYGPAAYSALLAIDSKKAKDILWQYCLTRYKKNKKDIDMLRLQQTRRYQPLSFELLVKGYRELRERDLLLCILSVDLPVGMGIVAMEGYRIPRYSWVAPNNAARFVAALNGLMADLKRDELTPKELKRLREIHALMVKKHRDFVKSRKKKGKPAKTSKGSAKKSTAD